jgi:glutathione synthase/RimK-type ligase-like ATP-grasp enzyme
MDVTIKINSVNTYPNACTLPRNIFNSLNLSTETPYIIHFGLSNETTLIGFSETEDKAMYFSESIFNQLKLLQDIIINIWKTNEGIFLGPVIGIFVKSLFIKQATRNNHYAFVRQHSRASHAENCFSYLFSANDIDWSEKKVKGYTFVPELGKYDFWWFPLPNVLYDKAGGGNKKENLLVKKQRRKLKNNPKIKLINNLNMLGKWEVCEALAKHPEAKKYVPETIIYKNFDDVLHMLNKNELIFMKSYYGSGGKEVLSVEKFSDKYKLNYYKMGAKELLLDNINEVQEFATKFIGNKKFIIQQGIRLLTYNSRNMDIRIFIMKNEFGMWESIFKGARIAQGKFSITNTRAGADYAIYEQLYPQLKKQYNFLEVPSTEKLDEAVIILASYIERELGNFGEIGLDIGLDINGGIWILEANSKPDKELESNIFDINGKPWVKLVPKFYRGTSNNSKIQPQALGIYKYAKFLTGR